MTLHLLLSYDFPICSQTTFHWGERPLLGTLPGRAGATFGPCSVPGLLLTTVSISSLHFQYFVEVEFDPANLSAE